MNGGLQTIQSRLFLVITTSSFSAVVGALSVKTVARAASSSSTSYLRGIVVAQIVDTNTSYRYHTAQKVDAGKAPPCPLFVRMAMRMPVHHASLSATQNGMRMVVMKVNLGVTKETAKDSLLSGRVMIASL